MPSTTPEAYRFSLGTHAYRTEIQQLMLPTSMSPAQQQMELRITGDGQFGSDSLPTIYGNSQWALAAPNTSQNSVVTQSGLQNAVAPPISGSIEQALVQKMMENMMPMMVQMIQQMRIANQPQNPVVSRFPLPQFLWLTYQSQTVPQTILQYPNQPPASSQVFTNQQPPFQQALVSADRQTFTNQQPPFQQTIPPASP